ncbi:MAG: reductive dehalogenase domain-containing protein [Verrucomicrobiota bacterium]|nr:reductive dehalogenase domain-containing protein [Verrucomicrobiota bacterium]
MKAEGNVQSIRSELESIARWAGAKAFGVANLTALKKADPNLLARVGADFPRAAVMGLRLQKAALDGIRDRPTPLYFHHYRQLNYQLDTLALRIADHIQDEGFRALAVPASQVIGKEPMRGAVSHRAMGWAAGLGHRGRNNLLVHPEFGSRMRYVTVLTDAPLRADKPVRAGCGSCRACVAACPAKAIKMKTENFDLAACYAALTEFTKIPFIGQHVCGVCVKACAGRRRMISAE